jgi:type IV pilus assembly protein PilB
MDSARPDTPPDPVSTPGDAPRLGEFLLQEGLITRGQLQEALRAQGEVRPSHLLLGQILVDQKAITRRQLVDMLDRYGRPRLGEILVAIKAITREQLEFALEQQQRTGLRLGDILVKLSFVTEREMKQALCAQLSIPFVDLDNLVIDRRLAPLVEPGYAEARGVLPVSELGDVLTVAMDDPTDRDAVETLAARTGRTVEVVTSTRAAFRRAFSRLYGGELDASVETANRLEFVAADTTELLAPVTYGEEIQRADALVRHLIALAMRWRASDIHLETIEKSLRARFRIDGVLQELSLGGIEEAVDKHHREIMSRLRILANMNIADRRRPQDGSFRARLAEEGEFVTVNFRVSIIPGYFGDSAVLRVLDPRNMPRWVQDLGLSKTLLDRLMATVGRLAGTLLITGPTGSGKSTTLYALLQTIARPEIRILTAEDPIEYVFPHFSQFEVNDRVGNTYATYLRAFLHHDPEVIMLGEILDADSAVMALRAAQTGHLVLTTLHTTDAVGSVHRLLDLGVPRGLLAAALQGAINQRLVRTVCAHCPEPYTPADTLIEEFFGDAPPPLRWMHGHGCPRCNFTGYRGRIAVAELWVPSAADQALLGGGAPVDDIRVNAQRSTVTVAEDVRDKLLAGRTTLEELKRVLPPSAIGQFYALAFDGAGLPAAGSASPAASP